jgi:hypothetical protein
MKNLRVYLTDWLNDYGLESLAEHDIRVSTDCRFPGLYNLKYGILSDKSLPIVQACRGAVVERVDDDGDHSPYFRLVAYAFDRFFNLGEPLAAEIDWPTAKVYEKYDGSLIKLFWNGVQWVVSTSGSVGGAGNVGSSGKTFEELFWDTFRYMRYNAFDLDPNYCYVFELCAPENRVVVSYEEPMLRLLAVRDRANSFEELPLGDFKGSFWVAESFDFGAWQLVEEANARGADHEGFIVCDSTGNRIKVKSDVYVQLHRVRGNGEPDFSTLYLNDDLDEFLLHFPDFRPKFQPLLDRLGDLDFMVRGFVDLYSNLPQKEFAAIVLENHPNVSGAMFGLRSGKYRDFYHCVAEMTPKQLDRLLGLCAG